MACLLTAAHQGRGERTFIATCQANQSRAVLLKIIEGGCAFLLGGFPHLELRDELAKILITFAGFAQQWQACWLRYVLMRQPLQVA